MTNAVLSVLAGLGARLKLTQINITSIVNGAIAVKDVLELRNLLRYTKGIEKVQF